MVPQERIELEKMVVGEVKLFAGLDPPKEDLLSLFLEQKYIFLVYFPLEKRIKKN